MEQSDFILRTITEVDPQCSLLELEPAAGEMPEIKPGQFAQILTRAQGVMLRRPISICDVENGHIVMLVRRAGRGTAWLDQQKPGTIINLVLPLGHGYTIPASGSSVLAVGGGVGGAPLLYLGRRLKQAGVKVTYLLGFKSKSDITLLDRYDALGQVFITTEDGSCGVQGFVTASPELTKPYDMVSCCGPTPMMKAVARMVTGECEVSLENMMACGLGACLCCVEKTVEGNLCACKEGPVFNTKKLLWQA